MDRSSHRAPISRSQTPLAADGVQARDVPSPSMIVTSLPLSALRSTLDSRGDFLPYPMTACGHREVSIPSRLIRAFNVVRGIPMSVAASFLFPSVTRRTDWT